MVVTLTVYRAALDTLYARTAGGWKFGLDTTRALLAALGNPHRELRTFHVGGTNGKGSTVHTLDALLRARGFRCGRYTSPHLVDFRERMTIDGRPIAEEAVLAFTDRWMPEIERLGASFFEATTCMALDWFAAEEVDVAVIEVGLGGRLDATNVITPLVAAVTSIGLDHREWLGESLESIAREKAGIFKEGVPAAIGERTAPLRSLLADSARDAGARPVCVLAEERPAERIEVSAGGTSFDARLDGERRRLLTPLVGAHQAHNTLLALVALEMAGPPFDAAVGGADAALSRVRVPGRFHRVGPLIFDVAHNADGSAALAETLDVVRPPRPTAALFAVLADKDWRRMMDVLAPHVDRFVLTVPPTAPPERAWRVEEADAFARERGWTVERVDDFDAAVTCARAGVATTLVTGSFHTVGDCMARLQIDPLTE